MICVATAHIAARRTSSRFNFNKTSAKLPDPRWPSRRWTNAETEINHEQAYSDSVVRGYVRFVRSIQSASVICARHSSRARGVNGTAL
jgi:hypothetical protein